MTGTVVWGATRATAKTIAPGIGRFVRHPRVETARLKQVAADGEHGSSPFIEIALVAR